MNWRGPSQRRREREREKGCNDERKRQTTAQYVKVFLMLRWPSVLMILCTELALLHLTCLVPKGDVVKFHLLPHRRRCCRAASVSIPLSSRAHSVRRRRCTYNRPKTESTNHPSLRYHRSTREVMLVHRGARLEQDCLFRNLIFKRRICGGTRRHVLLCSGLRL
jgi:hypothetical protein